MMAIVVMVRKWFGYNEYDHYTHTHIKANHHHYSDSLFMSCNSGAWKCSGIDDIGVSGKWITVLFFHYTTKCQHVTFNEIERET